MPLLCHSWRGQPQHCFALPGDHHWGWQARPLNFSCIPPSSVIEHLIEDTGSCSQSGPPALGLGERRLWGCQLDPHSLLWPQALSAVKPGYYPTPKDAQNFLKPGAEGCHPFSFRAAHQLPGFLHFPRVQLMGCQQEFPIAAPVQGVVGGPSQLNTVGWGEASSSGAYPHKDILQWQRGCPAGHFQDELHSRS